MDSRGRSLGWIAICKFDWPLRAVGTDFPGTATIGESVVQAVVAEGSGGTAVLCESVVRERTLPPAFKKNTYTLKADKRKQKAMLGVFPCPNYNLIRNVWEK